MTVQSYPLAWPAEWPRRQAKRDTDRRFYGPTYRWDRVYKGLIQQLGKIGATDIVVSTNQPLRQDGTPYAQQRNISDVGVAVYFVRRKRPMVMAQDRFDTVMGNMRSLAMAIEGLRQMERHGGAAMLEKAFTGFVAIAPPDWKKPWREVFGLKPDWHGSPEQLRALYKEKAKIRHGDSGGNDSLMAELNVAYSEGRAMLEGET